MQDRPGFSEILTILESGHTEEAELKEIDFTDLEFGDELETGAGTAVYKGQWISKNLVVAIKQVTGKIKEEEVSFANLFQRVLTTLISAFLQCRLRYTASCATPM